MMQRTKSITVHQFIQAIADLGIARLNAEDRQQASKMFLTYGVGSDNLRGVTYYNVWQTNSHTCGNGCNHGQKPTDKPESEKHAFVEICAKGQSDAVQLAGTTLHEIGHVLAGYEAAHGKDWKQACAKLGINCVKASGTIYVPAMFASDIRSRVMALIARLEASEPAFYSSRGKIGIRPVKPAGCPAGIGTRGGTSRGKGSGSRMLKLSCNDCSAVWRMAGKWIEKVQACPCCQSTNIDKPETD